MNYARKRDALIYLELMNLYGSGSTLLEIGGAKKIRSWS